MKILASICLILALGVSVLRADFLSPFADARVGSTVTADGEIVADLRPGQATVYFVRFRTDTGPETIPADLPAGLMHQVISGRVSSITATIREREDPKTKTRVRFLEVVKVDFSK
jgi:hypothetical protein